MPKLRSGQAKRTQTAKSQAVPAEPTAETAEPTKPLRQRPVPAAPPLSPEQQRFAAMMEQIQPALHNPQARLRLAKDLFFFANDTQLASQLRLDAMQQAIRIDPFSIDYRLALIQLE